MPKLLHLTRLEATLELPEVAIPGYEIVSPPMPPRRRVTIEEFEADMRAARRLSE